MPFVHLEAYQKLGLPTPGSESMVIPSARWEPPIFGYPLPGFTASGRWTWWYEYSPSGQGAVTSVPTEFLVSTSGQMSVPTSVGHRWGLDRGGRVTVIDLGDAVVLLPPGDARRSSLKLSVPRTIVDP